MELARLRLILFSSFATFIHCLLADIADIDGVWRQRAEEAMNATIQAYDTNPEAVINNFNSHKQ